LGRSKAWGELAYRPLTPPWDVALELFRFAGAWAPSREHIESGWGAWDGDRLCGAFFAERSGASAMLHGPVVVAPSDTAPEGALEVASELLAAALQQAAAQGVDTVFTRPQGLDRIWVRHGFIPVPEAELPAALRGRPGVGLFGWRGGMALWTAAGRGAARRPGAMPQR
jgi:hypothetical protein